MGVVPGIIVNGIRITPEQIGAEVQYHSASSLPEAKYKAMQALVIREILLQEAVRRGFCDQKTVLSAPEDAIDILLDNEIKVPEADEESCRRYYEKNTRRFYTAPLFDVSHILVLAPPGGADKRSLAQEKAEDILKTVKQAPASFAQLARELSACSSAKQDGRLGQISKGQTVPAFEAALYKMQAGDISETPVETEVGFHIIKVHERADGRLLPFENVRDWIADFLTRKSWQCAVSQYIQILAAQSEISGFQLKSAESFLVQ